MGLFYLVLGVGLLLAGLAALRWLSRVPPRHVAAGLRWLAIGAGGLVAAWLLLTGRAAQVVFVLLPFLPAIEPAEIRRLLEDKAFDINAMRQTLGVAPVSLREGLARTFSAPHHPG